MNFLVQAFHILIESTKIRNHRIWEAARLQVQLYHSVVWLCTLSVTRIICISDSHHPVNPTRHAVSNGTEWFQSNLLELLPHKLREHKWRRLNMVGCVVSDWTSQPNIINWECHSDEMIFFRENVRTVSDIFMRKWYQIFDMTYHRYRISWAYLVNIISMRTQIEHRHTLFCKESK